MSRMNFLTRLVMRCVLFSTTFIFCARVEAQEYGFDTWTTANGLPQNTVTGVAQTPDGYLWLSTFDGIARFDGVRFTIFDKGNTKGIVNNRFSRLFVDKAGAVWAVTENGVVTIYRNGTFTSYPTSETVNGPIDIVSDGAGNALIEAESGFYYLQDGKLIPDSDQKEINVKQIYYGKSGAKWTFERNGISREKDGQLTTYSIQLPSEVLATNYSLIPFEDNRGALWFRLSRHELCRLADSVVTVLTKNEIPALRELLPMVIFDDAEGSVWFLLEDATSKSDGQFVRFKDNQFTSYKLGKPDRKSTR